MSKWKFEFDEREIELLKTVLSRASADVSVIAAVTPAGYLAREIAQRTIQSLLADIEGVAG